MCGKLMLANNSKLDFSVYLSLLARVWKEYHSLFINMWRNNLGKMSVGTAKQPQEFHIKQAQW